VATTGKKATSRIRGTEIFVGLPQGIDHNDSSVQDVAKRAAIRALKAEAEALLPQRIATLAAEHDFTYRSVTIKQLKGRWGSCSQHKDIVFNCFLMQLPWELIDYVIMHELVHTQIMAHGEPFWAEVAKYVPRLTAVRKTMRTHQPTL
jgi:predicted metal-dependent hydrolase